MDSGICREICNFPVCLWAAGLCAVPTSDCLRPASTGCLECPLGLVNINLTCASACPHAYQSKLSFCYPSEDTTTLSAPDVLTVQASDSDFTSLSQALAAARLRHTVLYLQASLSPVYPTTYFNVDPADPLSHKEFQSLLITSRCGQSCQSTLRFQGQVRLTCTGNVTLANLRIAASIPLSEVFRVQSGASLTLVNVQITALSMLFSPFIGVAGGDLTLRNVTFSAMHTSDPSTLIQQTQPGGLYLLDTVSFIDSQHLSLLQVSAAASVHLSRLSVSNTTSQGLISVQADWIYVEESSFQRNQAESLLVLAGRQVSLFRLQIQANSLSQEVVKVVNSSVVTITNCGVERTLGSALIQLSAVASVHVSSLQLQNNSMYLGIQVVQTALFRLWEVTASRHRAYVEEAELIVTKCKALLSVSEAQMVQLGPIRLVDNDCDAGLALNQVEQALVQGLVSEHHLGSVITGQNTNITLLKSSISDTYGTSAVWLSSSSLQLANCAFSDNRGTEGAAIYLESPSGLRAAHCSFARNSVPANSGAGICVKGVTGIDLNLAVLDTYFEENSALRGGAISITSDQPRATLALLLSNTVFKANSASVSGAAILLGENIVLKQSLILNCLFAVNRSPSGSLTLQFDTGDLVLQATSFEVNSGELCSGIAIEPLFSCTLRLVNCEWRQNDGSAIRQPVGHPAVVLLSTGCVFDEGSGLTVVLTGAVWTDMNSRFSRSSSSALQLIGVSATLLNTLFLSNSNPGGGGGGAMDLDGFSTITCINCEFRNNTSTLTGGAIYLQKSARLHCLACLFIENSAAERGGAVFLFFSLDAFSAFLNCVFEGNSARYDGTVSAVVASYFLSNCTLRGNLGGQNPGLSVVLGMLVVDKTMFERQSASLVAFVYLGTSSAANITNCVFKDAISSSAIFSFTSSMLLSACMLTNITSTQGGVIYAMEESVVVFENVIASNFPRGGLMRIVDSTLIIRNSTFTDFQQGGIFGSNSHLSVTNSWFSGGVGTHGGVLTLQSSWANVSTTVFHNNSGVSGGALYSADSRLKLFANRFTQNNALQGGGVYMTSELDLPFTDVSSVYSRNSAEQGGGLYLAGQVKANFTSISLHQNQAIEGGGIKWTVWQPVIHITSSKGNQAQYGPDVASFPYKLELISPCGTSPCTTPVVAPGQLIPFEIWLRITDHMNQTMNLDNSTIVILSPVKPQIATDCHCYWDCQSDCKWRDVPI